jgi:hypothetical protein
MTRDSPSSPGPLAERRLNLRYVALLLGAALLILAVGSALRPKEEQPVLVPTNQLATLPERSLRRDLREMAEFVGQRASASAGSVVYLPAIGASGLRVGPDTVVSAVMQDGIPRILVSRPATRDTAPPAERSALADVPGPRWSIALARSPDDRLLSVAGFAGSAAEVLCGGMRLHELAFGASLPAAFAGGGLFDLDGNVLALAVPCGGHIALVPLAEAMEALGRQATPEFRLWTRFGFRVAPGVTMGLGPPGADSSLAVVEIRVGGPADRAGLRPGDVIVRLGTDRVAVPENLRPLLAAPAGTALDVRRGRTGVTLAPRIGAGPGWSEPDAGVPLRAVGPESRAARAGLRAGDRIVQIGPDQRPTAAVWQRALADSGRSFIIYEREGRRIGTALR